MKEKRENRKQKEGDFVLNSNDLRTVYTAYGFSSVSDHPRVAGVHERVPQPLFFYFPLYPIACDRSFQSVTLTLTVAMSIWQECAMQFNLPTQRFVFLEKLQI